MGSRDGTQVMGLYDQHHYTGPSCRPLDLSISILIPTLPRPIYISSHIYCKETTIGRCNCIEATRLMTRAHFFFLSFKEREGTEWVGSEVQNLLTIADSYKKRSEKADV